MKAFCIIVFGLFIIMALAAGTGNNTGATSSITPYASTKLTAVEKTWMDKFRNDFVLPMEHAHTNIRCTGLVSISDVTECVRTMDRLAIDLQSAINWLENHADARPSCMGAVYRLRGNLQLQKKALLTAVGAFERQVLPLFQRAVIAHGENVDAFLQIMDELNVSMKTC